ncbi:hypothetical protein NliqN6_1341 [Naganishia liquefaciens]|uniref:Nitronate monooxygenase n=1 Tax=Naganishia liquefaciens TaxID=104408 RepID=A0A8H3YD52_9TREE|nr:hypothetical protein NliqN6_1341 [Naganishia liquefaciens]
MSPRIKTPLNAILPSLRVPIVCGPMSGAAGGKLAAHVSKAGGLGFIGGGYFSPEQYTKNLEEAAGVLYDEATEHSGRLDVGVGFLGWGLSKLDGPWDPATDALGNHHRRTKAIACIDAALAARPRAVWLAFGTTEEMAGWARIMRERERKINNFEGLEMWKLFVGVGSVEEAKAAVELVGADVIVAQGCEAGGHGSATAPPLLNLLSSIVKALPTFIPLDPATRPLVLGAGGLSSGDHLAALLALGADGAVYGTRFLFTPESTYSATRKSLLCAAASGSTKRSMAFDEARNTLDWPAGVDGRGIVNRTVEEYERGDMDLAQRQERYARADREDDAERLIVWAGTGVGDVAEISPARDVVRLLEKEAVNALGRVSRFLSAE